MTNPIKLMSLAEYQELAGKFIEQGNDLYRLVIDQYDFDGIYRPDLCIEDDGIVFSYLGKSPSLHKVEIYQDIKFSEIPFGSTDDEIEKVSLTNFLETPIIKEKGLKTICA